MRKILSSLMILTLIILFGATFYVSIQAEAGFKAQLDRLNQDYPGLIAAELQIYQRGLLLSKARTSFQVGEEDPLLLDHRLRHFPWGVTMLTDVVADSALGRQLAEVVPLKQLQLTSEVGLSGDSEHSMKIRELKIDSEGEPLLLKGLDFVGHFDAALTSGDVRLKVQSLELQETAEVGLLLEGISLNSQVLQQQQLPLGTGALQIDRLRIDKAGEQTLLLNDLRYQTHTGLQDDELLSRIELQLAELQLAEETFNHGELKLAVSGIKTATLLQLQEELKQLQLDLLGEEVDPLIMQLQLLNLYTQLFRDPVLIQLEQLGLQADQGKLHGQGSLSLQNLNLNLDGGSPLAFEKLAAQLQVDIDQPIFNTIFRVFDRLQRQGRPGPNSAQLNEQGEQLAGAFIQKGLLTRREDGGLRSELRVEGGKAELNGQPFRL